MTGARAAIRRGTTTWVALFATWWLLVGEWSWWSAAWGAGCAATATVAVAVLDRPPSGSAARGWARDLGRAVVQVVVDFAVITRLLARSVVAGDRGPHGRFVHRSGSGRGNAGPARRAWWTYAATLSPNAYVIDVDPRSGDAELHDLVVHRASEQPW